MQAHQESADELALRREATIIGILVEFFISIQTTGSIAFYIRHGPNLAPFVYPQPNIYAFVLAGFFPFLFSLGYKYMIRPKGRTVSPAFVFLGAFLFNTLFLADYIIRAPSDYYYGTLIPVVPSSDMWGYFAVFGLTFLFLVAFLASFSVAGVRLALGLSVEGVDRRTFTVSLGHEAVFNAFKSGSRTSVYLSRFREREQNDNAIYLKRKYPSGDEIILAFGFNPDRPDQGTIIATAAYSKNAYGLFPSKSASDTRDSIINDITGRCAKSAGKLLEPEERKETNDFVSERVYEIAVSPAKAWLSIVKDSFLELDRYFQWAIVSTIGAIIIASAASAYGLVGTNGGDILTVLFALMVGEIGLAIREERAKGKKSPTWKFAK
jgi:hypothetical protein